MSRLILASKSPRRRELLAMLGLAFDTVTPAVDESSVKADSPALLTERLSRLKAEAVRALRSDAFIRPNEAERKVYILCHSELLNQTGQNILLKLIEEGPAYAAFLFLTPNPEMLLPTIRSRCETLRAPGEEEQAAAGDGARLAARGGAAALTA